MLKAVDWWSFPEFDSFSFSFGREGRVALGRSRILCNLWLFWWGNKYWEFGGILCDLCVTREWDSLQKQNNHPHYSGHGLKMNRIELLHHHWLGELWVAPVTAALILPFEEAEAKLDWLWLFSRKNLAWSISVLGRVFFRSKFKYFNTASMANLWDSWLSHHYTRKFLDKDRSPNT